MPLGDETSAAPDGQARKTARLTRNCVCISCAKGASCRHPAPECLFRTRLDCHTIKSSPNPRRFAGQNSDGKERPNGLGIGPPWRILRSLCESHFSDAIGLPGQQIMPEPKAFRRAKWRWKRTSKRSGHRPAVAHSALPARKSILGTQLGCPDNESGLNPRRFAGQNGDGREHPNGLSIGLPALDAFPVRKTVPEASHAVPAQKF